MLENYQNAQFTLMNHQTEHIDQSSFPYATQHQKMFHGVIRKQLDSLNYNVR